MKAHLRLCHVLLAVLFTMPTVISAQTLVLTSEIAPPPGELVDVGDHKLHIYCTGEGDPAVILISGRGGTVLDAGPLQAEIAGFTRVCSYDRAGTGWSDSGPMPRTIQRTVDDLKTLLENAEISSTPYVVVGFSLGGLYARVFVSQNPASVAGILLIDGTPPHYFQLINDQFPEMRQADEEQVAFFRNRAEELRSDPPQSVAEAIDYFGFEAPQFVPDDLKGAYMLLRARTDFFDTLWINQLENA